MITSKVRKKVLKNGLTVLVVPQQTVPKVSVQLWYNVGSKDEKSGEKGIAHFIEHMIFKGTEKLSESDINMITHKLSGYCNAFTSYDYTGYLFDFPAHNWKEALPIMADCMRNCTFKEEFLYSELKAVIQELKMYNDDYGSTLVEKMIGAIFNDHPYHHPIIGYKHDLWSLQRDTLVNFYKKHYIPNNATLVIVGDVEEEVAFNEAEAHFEAIPAVLDYKKETFCHNPDIVAQSITLYRDVQKPIVLFAWTIPGIKDKKDYILDVMSWVIGAGRGARFYKLLVDEKKVATEVESFVYDLFDVGLFFVQVQPAEGIAVEEISQLIQRELDLLANGNISADELKRAIKKTEVDFVSLQEHNQKMAYVLGKYFTALGDEHYLEQYCDYPRKSLKSDIESIIGNYLRPTVMHRGMVLPIPEQEKKYWHTIQDYSDAQDKLVLSRITREAHVEEGSHVHAIVSQAASEPFNFPQAKICTLSNGLKVLYAHVPHIPKIDIVIDFKAKHFYDPQDKQGLSTLLFDCLQEGTKNYSAQELAQAVESYGMSLNTFPGHMSMSMLSSDLKNGLHILYDVLTQATFSAEGVEKVKTQILVDIANFWDSPSSFVGQLAREEVYKNHPYAKNILGSEQSIRSIVRNDLLKAYKEFITPHETRIAIVGDLSAYSIEQLCEQLLGTWEGPKAQELIFPALMPVHHHERNYTIARDQIVLAYAGLSVSRYDADFDKLLLFDQIFGGGVLQSMHSRLFELREQSGLFYTISGSLLARVDEQPGMSFIKTIVSPDRLSEAEKKIETVINNANVGITNNELEEARNAVINSLVDNFSSNKQMATTFLFLDTFGFPQNYFDHRAQQLEQVTVAEIKDAVAKILHTDRMVKIRIGRINGD